MKNKLVVVPRAVRPEEPVRQVGLIRLGKIVLLGLLLITTTATIAAVGWVGKTSSVAKSYNQRQNEVSSAIETAPAAGPLAVTQSIVGPAVGVGTLLFWLGLAGVNVRRKGVKDNRSAKRVPANMAPLPHAVVPQGAVRSRASA